MKSKKIVIIVSTVMLLVIALLLGLRFRILDTDIFRNHRSDFESEFPDSYSDNSALFIPELIDMTEDHSEFEITVDETEFEFFTGYRTLVKSYNEQGYLGKTIKLRRGNTFYPSVTNNLDEMTTIHWHGLEVIGDNDALWVVLLL